MMDVGRKNRAEKGMRAWQWKLKRMREGAVTNSVVGESQQRRWCFEP